METVAVNNSDLVAKKLALQAVLKLKTEELRKLCLSEAVSIYPYMLYTVVHHIHLYTSVTIFTYTVIYIVVYNVVE